MDVNLFKVYSNNDETILDSTIVDQNLNNISKLLDENKKNLSALSDENKELTDDDDEIINTIFNFNVVDLMPVDTFRGCVNSILFTDASKPNSVSMPITVARNISQFVDNLALDTGTSYLSLSLQTPNPVSYPLEQENLEKIKYLQNKIDHILLTIKSIPVQSFQTTIESFQPTLEGVTIKPFQTSNFNDLFAFMIMYLIVENQLSDEQKAPLLLTKNICLNYTTTYIILLNLFPAFVTCFGSNVVLKIISTNTTYSPIFSKIFDILKNVSSEEAEDEIIGDQIADLFNVVRGEEEVPIVEMVQEDVARGVDEVGSQYNS